MTELLRILSSLPRWLLWTLAVLGGAGVVTAFGQWMLSWAGSDFKGITGGYWLRLVLLVALSLLCALTGVLGLAGG